jgi:hypothetical protein
MLDHEERFLFREEILNLGTALAEPGQLDNVEDLLAEVTTSPRFDSDVFTLERSLQVMLGGRAGSTMVGLLTIGREVFDEIGDIGLPAETHERLVSWRARFGLAIDNALNFLNNPDGIQGHNFGTQVSHGEGGTALQGRLTLVRYNNEPQFFIADADVLLTMAADMMERLGEHLEPEMLDAELVTRLHEAVDLVERRSKPPASARRPTGSLTPATTRPPRSSPASHTRCGSLSRSSSRSPCRRPSVAPRNCAVGSVISMRRGSRRLRQRSWTASSASARRSTASRGTWQGGCGHWPQRSPSSTTATHRGSGGRHVTAPISRRGCSRCRRSGR